MNDNQYLALNITAPVIIKSSSEGILTIQPCTEEQTEGAFKITYFDDSYSFKEFSEVQGAFDSGEWSMAKIERSNSDIAEVIIALQKDIETIGTRIKENFYPDVQAAYNMIHENQCRIHTLEWVLGEHERFD